MFTWRHCIEIYAIICLLGNRIITALHAINCTHCPFIHPFIGSSIRSSIHLPRYFGSPWGCYWEYTWQVLVVREYGMVCFLFVHICLAAWLPGCLAV